ncbi:glycosyltransferase family 8 protein [Helicobacter sp. L8]|uniref:glycosyltransferase family 8 protein n=1 Tax=Helicobacter sp. L8 TaxID=2316078 RepID=UPI0013CE35D3|nr:glycosyltransferase family 8 protein [Helicobacter sp. L8]
MAQAEMIPIVMAFDQRYCIPAGVAMHSMLACMARAHTPHTYTIHAFTQGLDQAHKDKLQENIASFAHFARLEFLDVDPTNHEPRTTNHEPRTTNHEPRTTNHEPRTPLP